MNLGTLYYSLGIKDLTDADFQKINKKLESQLGREIRITPTLSGDIAGMLPKGLTVNIAPNPIAQEALDKAIEGKVMRAEILPLVDKLKTSVVDALKEAPVTLYNITVAPGRMAQEISNALASANFTSVGNKAGEELAKAIKVKVEGEKYNVSLTVDTAKLLNTVNKAIEKVFGKEQKVKLDRSDIKTFRDELRKTISESVKVTPTLNVTQDALQRAVEGKVMKVEIAPLLTNFRKSLKDALTANPVEAEIGVQAAKLRNLITNVLNQQGFMINISTANDNYTKVVQQRLNGRVYTIKIHADAREIANSVQASLMSMQSRTFGLQVSKDILRNSIDQALMGKPFSIQIAVMRDQARRAVQNALNNARMVGKDDALAYQRLQTGELRAAQAELTRLKAAQQVASAAAKTHASASLSLGGAMGSNIRIAGELGSAMASLYSIHAIKQFLSQVIEIGGELEHQKIALETIYGSGSKKVTLYGQIKGLARESPFGVMELTKNIKQLSAYGVAYNEVYDTAKRLADISAATSVDIQRLILAFGKTKNRTFLDGLEAKQFAYANIPIYDQLSKKLTELEGKFVSVQDVMKRISKKEIGFDMVKEILWDMTDEGGKFYNMQEKLAGSVKTSWKLVRDNIELMFGEVAESWIGDVLKWNAEILQGLTREWKTLGGAVLAGAAAFGVYKLAVLASNIALGKHNLSLMQSTLAQKNEILAKTTGVSTYRTLTFEEGRALLVKKALNVAMTKNIFTSKQLSEAQLFLLMREKILTKEMALRLIATNKISKANAGWLYSMGLISKVELATALNSANATKQFKFMRMQITLNATRFKLLSAAAWGAVKAIGSFALASLPMVAIGAVVGLWQKNNEEMEKAKEIGDNIFNKANDGAKELQETLDGLKPVKLMSEPEIAQGIETLKNAIKDFSINPAKDLNNALYDPNGKTLSLQTQYENLLETVKKLRAEFEAIKKLGIGNDVTNAIKNSDSGWFDDNVNTDAADFDKALKKREAAIQKYVAEYAQDVERAVESARKADSDFAQATEGMSNSVAFEVLMKNQQRYANGFYIASQRVSKSLRDIFDVNKFDAQVVELEKEMTQVWDQLNASAKIKGLIGDRQTISDATDEVREEFAMAISDWINGLEVSDEAKAKMKLFYSNLLRLDMSGIDWNAQFSEEIQKHIGEKDPGLMNKIKNGVVLTEEEEKKILQYACEAWLRLAKKLPQEQRKALADAVAKQESENSYVLSKDDAMRIVAQMYIMTDDEQWKQEIDRATGNLPEIKTWLKGASDIPSFVKAVKEGYKNAKTTLDELKPLMLKAGLNIDFGKELPEGVPSTWYMSLTEAEKQMVHQYNEMIRVLKATQEAGDVVGFDPASDYNKSSKSKSSKGKGAQKDPFADAIKERIKILKEAKKEYDDLAKMIGADKAFERLKDSPIFKGLEANKYLPKQDIPQNIEQYKSAVDELQTLLTEKGLKTQEHRDLNVEIEKLKFNIEKGEINDSLKAALDKVSKEAERQLADWGLFDKIRKATGNQNLAMNIAFGMNATAETDYPTMLKKQFAEVVEKFEGFENLKFDEIADAESLKDTPDEVKKAWEKTYEGIKGYLDKQREMAVEIVGEYQSLADKLVKIDADRERDIKTVRESDMSDADKEKYIQRINVEADYEKFEKSNDYLRFFNDVYGLTMTEANRIGDLIQLNLNQKLQAGLISIYDYEKEMEKVRKQLEILHNVKSNALTFLTSGIKGLSEKKLREEEGSLANDAGYQKALEEQIAKQNTLDDAIKEGNEERIKTAEEELKLANETLKSYTKIRDAIIADQERWKDMLDVANIAANIAGGMSDAFGILRDMADSFGFDTDSDAWNTVGALMDTLTTVTGGVQKMVQSLMNGDIGGVISGAFSTLFSPFTIWSKLHDQKLQKMIERSKGAAQILQNQYDILEKRMTNFLGNSALMNTGVLGGGYGQQRNLLKGQLDELEKQRQLEMEKKKSDDSVVEDYNKQIEEMKIQIRDFAIEVAQDLYGIDLNGWAEQLGDALVEAFAAGEDAAEAFNNTVGDIMRDVTSKMISQDILAPMFGDLRDYLFGSDGISGAFGADFTLDPSEMGAMKEYLDKIKDEGLPAAQKLFEAINEATDGLLTEADNDKSSMTAGLQSLTEDTGDLLVSYINAIRADVAANRMNWDELLKNAFPQMNILSEAQLAAQRQIAENTLRNAIAAERLVKYAESIDSRIRRAQADKSTGFYIR